MPFVTVDWQGAPRGGNVSGGMITMMDVPDALAAWRAPDAKQIDQISVADARIMAPVMMPGKILGLGLNYQDHATEGGRDTPKHPKWFNKQTSALNPYPMETVLKPTTSNQVDYEGELVVIIGKAARNITAGQALSHVAGYSVGCDYSVRDWQALSPTMHLGKSFDTHATFGPYLWPTDQVPDPQGLRIQTWVNDDLRQDAPTSNMIHAVADQIATLSHYMTLHPGDVLYTGTPAGVGQWFDPPKFLEVGDTVRVEIVGLGTLQNTVIADTP